MGLEETPCYQCTSSPREGDSADTVGIAIARADIPMLLAGVDPDLIYNFDKTGLLFRQLPKKSLASVHSKGRKGTKLAKDRIIVGLFVNATGTLVQLSLAMQSLLVALDGGSLLILMCNITVTRLHG